MTERERLIELVKVAREHCNKVSCVVCRLVKSVGYPDCRDTLYADYLLENGVIVPPCKVGDVVYDIHNGKVFGGKVILINIFDGYLTFAVTGGRYFGEDEIGKTVFLTKEEAEQALKGAEGK